MNVSQNRPFPWRLFWLLFAAVTFSVLAALPIALDLVAGIIGKLEFPKAPLPLLILVGAIQNLSLIALIVWLGLKLGRSLGLGAPFLESWTNSKPETGALGSAIRSALFTGLVVGLVLLLVLLVLVQWLPNIPLALAARLPVWKRVLVCFYGGIYEEVLTRLFLLTLVAWIANRSWRKPPRSLSSAAFWFANIFAAILFGLGHLPSASLFMAITPLVVAAALLLNGIAGIAFGYLYRTRGLEAAMIAHFVADFVIYVLGAAFLKS